MPGVEEIRALISNLFTRSTATSMIGIEVHGSVRDVPISNPCGLFLP